MRIFVITRKQLTYGLMAAFFVIGLFCAIPVTKEAIRVTGSRKTIVIDAGHGSIDPGGTHGGLKEKEINLQVAFLLKEILEDSNFRVVMTRTDDSLYNQNRRDDILYRVRKTNEENPEAMVSIHVNKFPTAEPFGGQVYYYSNGASKALAEKIQEQLKIIQPTNYRTIGFGDYYVLRKTACPAVLVEIGFISNPVDRERITDPAQQRLIAKAIRDGLVNFFSAPITETIDSVDSPTFGTAYKLADLSQGYDLYFLRTTQQGESLVPVHRPVTVSVQSSRNTFLEDVAREAIRELIEGPEDRKLSPVIPSSTRLLSVTVKEGLATVNFSRHLIDDHWGGAKTEYLTVASIVRTLTAFPGIDRVQLLIEGRKGESIAGHIVFDEPFTPETFR